MVTPRRRPTFSAAMASAAAFALSAAALASSVFLMPGCADKGDLYARAYPACHGIRIPKLGDFLFDMSDEERKTTYLTPECKAVLEEIIPYDRESFKNQPWLMDRVNEGMQTLLGDYPLRFPAKSTIFGTSPSVGGAMPTDIARAIGALSEYPEDLRKSIFNYILNQTDVVRLNYIIPRAGQVAQMLPEMDGRVMTIFKTFWDLDDPMTYLRNPFELTGTLVHEARHADGITHSLCPDSTYSTGFNCDATLAGPYGTGLFYFQALIHGSGVCEDATTGRPCTPAIPRYIVARAGYNMCEAAKKRTRNVYPELAQLLADQEEELGESCGRVAYTKTMELERLPLGSYDTDEPPTPKSLKISAGPHWVLDTKTYNGSYFDANASRLYIGAPFNLEIPVQTE